MFRKISGCLLAALLSVSWAAASETFLADVHLMSDTPDRLALALDRLGPDGVGDGLVDEAIYFTSHDRLGLPRDVVRDLPIDLDGASVTIGAHSVEVAGTDTYGVDWTVRLAMEPGQDERAERTRQRGRIELTLENGAALTRTERPSSAAQPLSLDAFQRISPAVKTVIRSDFFTAGDDKSDCQSGGPGSSGCSQSCNVEAGAGGGGGIVSLAFNGGQGQSCVVQCGDGHYSCCGCNGEFVSIGPVSIPLLVASCVCEAN